MIFQKNPVSTDIRHVSRDTWRMYRFVSPGGVDMQAVDSSWNVMAHDDEREGNWRGDWQMEWVASTLHTNSEQGVSNITTADAHTSAARCRLNWSPRRFKWTRPFRRKTNSDFYACAITFQTQSKHIRYRRVMSLAAQELKTCLGNGRACVICGIGHTALSV